MDIVFVFRNWILNLLIPLNTSLAVFFVFFWRMAAVLHAWLAVPYWKALGIPKLVRLMIEVTVG
jgi:hypothetical protein